MRKRSRRKARGKMIWNKFNQQQQEKHRYNKRKPRKCLICSNTQHNNNTKYKGTTQEYRNQEFEYARCVKCNSINKLTPIKLDYNKYAKGKRIFKQRQTRFMKYIKKNNIYAYNNILDYGCGSGIFLKQLMKEEMLEIDGYEPYNKEYNKLKNKKYQFIYLIHVLEHIKDYKRFFKDLNKITNQGSEIITIHPSSTRIKELNNKDIYQKHTIHAPMHECIPSDKAVIDMFEMNGFELKKLTPYDVQRSGLIQNNNVTALLLSKFDGIREHLINASNKERLNAYLMHPIKFVKNALINTKDKNVSTMVFERK